MFSTTILSSTEHPPTGGIKIQVGLDDNKNNKLDSMEVKSTDIIANGANGTNGTNGTNGLKSLVNITNEPVGSIECPTGGLRIASGQMCIRDRILPV